MGNKQAQQQHIANTSQVHHPNNKIRKHVGATSGCAEERESGD